MAADAELQKLRRRLKAAPDDREASLELAKLLQRRGAKDDATEAIEAFYRARALGADAKTCRDALEALEAPPSPWTHVSGDSERTFSTRIRGPRKGEIVARSAPRKAGTRWVVDENGALLGAEEAALVSLNGRTLAETHRERNLVAQAIAVARGGALIVGMSSGLPELTRISPELEEVKSAALENNGLVRQLMVEPDGRVLVAEGGGKSPVRAIFFDADLKAKDPLKLPKSLSPIALSGGRITFAQDIPFNQQISLFSSTGEAEIAVVQWNVIAGPAFSPLGYLVAGEIAEGGTLTVLVLDAKKQKGKIVRSHAIAAQNAPVDIAIARDGSIFVASTGELTRFDPEGDQAWKKPIAKGRPATLIVDAEGVVYAPSKDDKKAHEVVAFSPEGKKLFAVAGAAMPVAVDAFGRLIASCPDQTLVAIE